VWRHDVKARLTVLASREMCLLRTRQQVNRTCEVRQVTRLCLFEHAPSDARSVSVRKREDPTSLAAARPTTAQSTRWTKKKF